MKNIFKLTSVFLTIALLVSVLLISGSLVSAEQKNLITNGDFSDGLNGWTYSAYEDDWTVTNGKLVALANHGSKDDSLSPSFTEALKGETTYTLHVEITDLSGACVVRVNLDNNHEIADSPITATGDYTFTTYASVDLFKIKVLLPKNNSGATATFDNFILVEGDKIESETTAASATEATETATEATGTEATGTQPTTPGTAAAIATWSDTKGMEERDFSGAGHTGSIYMRQNVAGTNGTWGEFAATLGSLTADQYLDIVYTGTFTGALLENATLTSHIWSETESKTFAKILSVSDTQVNVRIEGPTTFANTAKPNLSLSIKNLQDLGEITDTHVTVTLYDKSVQPTGTEATEATGTEASETATSATETATEATGTEATGTEATGTEASVTETQATETEASVTETKATETEASVTETQATETEASATETKASETEASVTEPSATQPMTLVETVLVENNVGGVKTLKAGKTDAWFLVVNEVKADIAANGPIDPDKGEYYQITVTGSVDAGEADFHMGEDADWNEYWGQSGSFTTETSTVVATIPTVIPADLAGSVYLADSGADGHTLTWTYAKVSVFRLGAATEPSSTETEASSTETEASATETEASATETEASATETEASATETVPSDVEPTEVEPTGTGADEELLGDANNDGEINMKDVLALRKYIAGLEVEINEAAADANEDGEINMKDVLMLRKFIAGLVEKLGA